MAVDIAKARTVQEILREADERHQKQAVSKESSRLPATIADRLPSLNELLSLAYARPCGICAKSGLCGHREPEIEIELYIAQLRRPA